MRTETSDHRHVRCLDCDELSPQLPPATARTHAAEAGHVVVITHENIVTHHGEPQETGDTMPSVETAFGKLVRRARERKGFTQENVRTELARMGVLLEKTAYSRLETGQRPTRLNEVRALVALLGIDSKEFLP